MAGETVGLGALAPVARHIAGTLIDAAAPRTARSTATVTARMLGPLLIGEQHIVRLEREPRIETDHALARDMMLLFLPIDAPAHVQFGGVRQTCPADGGLLLDMGKRWSIDAEQGMRCHTLVLPSVFLALAAPGGTTAGVVPWTAGLGAIRTMVAGLLTLENMTAHEELLASGALQSLLAATFAAEAGADYANTFREVGLLQRTKDYVDRHLGEDLGIPALCTALACSRSALYRAVAPVGGVSELVTRRRLAAIYRCLADPADRRSIAAIAGAHGFAQATQFSRRFRQVYGVTARGVRDAAIARARPAVPGDLLATLHLR